MILSTIFYYLENKITKKLQINERNRFSNKHFWLKIYWIKQKNVLKSKEMKNVQKHPSTITQKYEEIFR